MSRDNYSYNKHQKELARKKKAEEKKQRKLDRKNIQSEVLLDPASVENVNLE